MNRRTYLATLGSLAAGSAAAMGTGAFTSVEANRSISVNVAGDKNAFLALAPSGGPNGDYADVTGNTLEVNIGPGDVLGDGVNLNAVTHIDRVFKVTNQGTQPVVVYFEEVPHTDHHTGNAIDIGAKPDQFQYVDYVAPDDQPTSDGIYDGNVSDLSNPSPPDEGGTGYGSIGVWLGVGDTLVVGFYVDTSDANLNDGLNESDPADLEPGDILMDGLVIWADADAADNGDYLFVADGNPDIPSKWD